MSPASRTLKLNALKSTSRRQYATTMTTIRYPFPDCSEPTPYQIFHLLPDASPAEVKQRCESMSYSTYELAKYWIFGRDQQTMSLSGSTTLILSNQRNTNRILLCDTHNLAQSQRLMNPSRSVRRAATITWMKGLSRTLGEGHLM